MAPYASQLPYMPIHDRSLTHSSSKRTGNPGWISHSAKIRTTTLIFVAFFAASIGFRAGTVLTEQRLHDGMPENAGTTLFSRAKDAAQPIQHRYDGTSGQEFHKATALVVEPTQPIPKETILRNLEVTAQSNLAPLPKPVTEQAVSPTKSLTTPGIAESKAVSSAAANTIGVGSGNGSAPSKMAANATGGDSKDAYDPENDPLIRHKMIDHVDLMNLLRGMEPGLPLVATLANSAFKIMLYNWLAHVQRAGMENVLVASLDEDLYKECVARGIPSLHLHSHLSKTDFRRDEKAFKNMGALKTGFLLSLVEQGWDVLMSDTDVVWLADPLELTKVDSPMGFADVVISSDSVSHSNDVASMKQDPTVWVRDDWQGWFRFATNRSTEIFGNLYEHAFNTGVLYLRSTPVTVKLCTAWHDVMRTRGKSMGWERIWGDQHALNQLMRIKMFPIKVVKPQDGRPRHNRVFWTFNHTLQLGVLPPGQFCNGHVYFVQRVPQSLGLRVYVVHNTFQYHYRPGKIARFREAGFWMLDSENYYTKGNFLSLDVTVPSWIPRLPEGLDRHRAAIQYYYEAIRNGLAIARTLNRTLILPKVVCYCDRWWDSLTDPCRAPGSDVDPPFTCPIDHYINPIQWGGEEDPEYRPYSFLEDPRTAREIVRSRLVVRVENDPGSGDGRSLDAPVRLPVNATDKEVWRALQSFSTTRVLHLPSPIDSFCRHESHDDNVAFDQSTTQYFAMEWCCTPQHTREKITIPLLSYRSYDDCRRSIPLAYT